MACRALFPRNLLRARTNAVGTPNSTFSGTTRVAAGSLTVANANALQFLAFSV